MLDGLALSIISQEFSKANRPDYSFAPDFERDLPEAYSEMLADLQPLHEVQVVADAIRGFHFTSRPLEQVNPVGGKLFFFPYRPLERHMQEIAELAALAPKWGERNSELTVSTGRTILVRCLEIVPSGKTDSTIVGVSINARYGHEISLLGLRVNAEDTLTWNVRDFKDIPVQV